MFIVRVFEFASSW